MSNPILHGGNDLLEHLLLAVLAIIVYTEVLPTISMVFELIRTWLAAKITIIQQHTVHAQEDIQDTQARMEPTNSVVIGFHEQPDPVEMEDEDYE